MMKIGIDTASLENQNAFRGVGSYTRNLIKGLEETKNVEIITGDWRKFWFEVDLIHFPYFDLFFHTLPIAKKKKTVVTIHDCIPLVFPEHYLAGVKGKLRFYIQKFSLGGVSSIITDSESSKKDVIKYLNVPEQKITTVYLAPAPVYKPARSTSILRCIEVKYKLPEKFVLYVGDINYNKNLPRLIEAFAGLKEKNLWLVLIGKAFENENLPEVNVIRGLIKRFHLEGKVKILGYVPAEDLAAIYSLASVYCQPSLYEGFGLQILEAMACGCPVVTSNASSLPEVAETAAILVNPYSPESISGGIKKAVEDKKLRSRMIEQGLEQAKKFSWEKTALKTVEVYEKILAK